MKIPKPYFKDVGEIGDLDMDYIFFEDTYPIFFVCSDKKDKKYICMCCDIVNEQRWIVAPIRQNDIINMLRNRITLRELFIKRKGKRFIITWDGEIETNKEVEIEEICSCDLPKVGEFYDGEEEELCDYVNYIKSKKEISKSVDETSIVRQKILETSFSLMFNKPTKHYDINDLIYIVGESDTRLLNDIMKTKYLYNRAIYTIGISDAKYREVDENFDKITQSIKPSIVMNKHLETCYS